MEISYNKLTQKQKKRQRKLKMIFHILLTFDFSNFNNCKLTGNSANLFYPHFHPVLLLCCFEACPRYLD